MISVDDVKSQLGIEPNDARWDTLVGNALQAAISYCASVRPDRDWSSPSDHERVGVIWLAARLYEERGTNGDGSVDSFTANVTPLLGRQAQQMLGIDTFYPPVVA